MRKVQILTLVVSLAAAALLGGCVIARDISGGMDDKAQEKFADKVAERVIQKCKAERCCARAMETAEPNKPCK